MKKRTNLVGMKFDKEKIVENFCGGVAFGTVIAAFATGLALTKYYEGGIREACQGKQWVIEEPLIKKTLTCRVEIKEKK